MTSKEFLEIKICPYQPQESNQKAKKRTFYAFAITFFAMVVEVIAGSIFNSMALLADGWHMSSHALALGLASLAYVLANHYAKNPHFNFGSYKVEILSAYSSALFLLAVAFFMAYHSVERFINPKEIAYTQAIIVAFIGLFVNAFCVWLLKDEEHFHSHSHHHDDHNHCEHSHDLNLKAAYLHVLADAMTSIFAIIALFGGLWFGIWWLDSLMGVIGSVLVFIWAVGLLKSSGKILLDMTMDKEILDEILYLSKDYGAIKDLHLLKISKTQYACILSIKSDKTLLELKEHFSTCENLAHLTIELV